MDHLKMELRSVVFISPTLEYAGVIEDEFRFIAEWRRGSGRFEFSEDASFAVSRIKYPTCKLLVVATPDPCDTLRRIARGAQGPNWPPTLIVPWRSGGDIEKLASDAREIVPAGVVVEAVDGSGDDAVSCIASAMQRLFDLDKGSGGNDADTPPST